MQKEKINFLTLFYSRILLTLYPCNACMTYAELPNLIPIMDDDLHTIGIETYNKTESFT